MPAPKKMVKVSARQITNAASDELTLLWDEAIPTFMDEKVDGHLYERIANKQTAFYGHKYGFKVYVTDDHIHYREIEVEFIVRGIVVNKDKYTYDVLPEYRGQGLAREIVSRYLDRERRKGRKAVLLTCLESKVGMYEKMGFRDRGMAQSTWGGEQWHEMDCGLNP